MDVVADGRSLLEEKELGIQTIIVPSSDARRVAVSNGSHDPRTTWPNRRYTLGLCMLVEAVEIVKVKHHRASQTPPHQKKGNKSIKKHEIHVFFDITRGI